MLGTSFSTQLTALKMQLHFISADGVDACMSFQKFMGLVLLVLLFLFCKSGYTIVCSVHIALLHICYDFLINYKSL